MSEKEGFVSPWLIAGLAFPVSILYLVRVAVTGTSLVWAAIGYVTMGLSFGLLQSVLKVRHPYLIAFISTALVPLFAYCIIVGIVVFEVLGILTGAPPLVTSGPLPVVPDTFIQRLGLSVGSILYCVIIFLMVVPFGLIGVSGRFLGSKLLPDLVTRIARKNVPLRREGGAVLLDPPEHKDISTARIAAYASITAAAVSALASVLIAVFS